LSLLPLGSPCRLRPPLLLLGLSCRFGPLREDRLYIPDQSLHVLVKIAPRTDIEAVTVNQLLKAIRKLVDVGHPAAFHEYRNDGHPAAEGRFDFDADGICRIVYSTPPSSRSKPTFADYHKRDVGLGKDGIDVFTEIDTQWDIVDIPKYRITAITSHKTIEYPPGNGGGIISPIGNRYPRHF